MDRQKRHGYAMGVGMILLVLTMALVAVGVTGCGDSAAAGAGPLKLVEADSGGHYTVKAGDTIEVAIAGNPTTGYEWTALDDDSGLLELVGDPAYVADETDSDIVGSGGTYTFTFTAAAAGEATIELSYARGWESVQPLKTFKVTVTVE
jgi:inhibitor of cysteine peptidase